jgi:exodeoxyribonuclease V gamma subunit
MSVHIHLNVSNNLRPLAQKMAADLLHPAGDVFTPSWIVTQTDGMNSWLREQLAHSLGIASNIRFSKPNDIVNRIHYLLDHGKHKAIDVESLRWTLYTLLGEQEFRNTFPAIATYYENHTLRQIAFAGELADIFDQYQIYRFKEISEWNRMYTAGEAITDWQAWLWTKAKARLGKTFADKSEIAEQILDKLKDDTARNHLLERFPALHFFGIAVITPYYLRIFYSMAEFMEMHFYLINPAPEDYWLEDKSEKQIARLRNREVAQSIRAGNDLLLNLGRVTKESFQLLLEQEDFVNNYEVLQSNPAKEPQKLLAKIQSDIHQNKGPQERAPLFETDLTDGSITLNGCYTPVREVETLYNYLVELVDRSPNKPSPREILVLVTDIDLYAPYIKAVFKHAPYRFPFTIADETITAENNLFTALQEILQLDAHFFKAEEVLGLLDSPYIRHRFQIENLEEIRTAVRQSGIRYNMEGRIEDETRFVSWNYGLKKILYGICMSGEETYDEGTETLIPLDTAEGSGAVERIHLLHFLKMLQEKIIKREQPRTIQGWADYLKEVLEDLVFASGEEEDEDYGTFLQLIDQLMELHGSDELQVSFEVFRHSFLHKLQQESRAAAFAGAGITFCSMVPMRSIPYKVVALLGMNFDKFPRKDSPLSFSLLSKERKPGDRNVKDNDKHLFLETLLSAEEKLYISYIARDPKDGSELPPSSLVDECIDYVARKLNMDTDALRKKWITLHPLHGFSRTYFLQDGPKNYLSEDRYKSGRMAGQDPSWTLRTFDFFTVEIDHLTDFFRNPAKTFLNKQLDVYYRDEDILLPDQEVFELDHLQRFIVQKDLMLADEEEVDAYIQQKKGTAAIPLHNMGKAAVKIAYQGSLDLRYQIRDMINGQPASAIDIEISVGATMLKGKIGPIYGNRFISICNSSNRMSPLLADYIRYLALIASGHSIDFIFLAKKIQPSSIRNGSITPEVAQQTLVILLEHYKDGHQSYYPFWPMLAEEKFKLIVRGWDFFYDQYEEAKENEMNFDFKNEYLERAVADGIFNEERFDELYRNVKDIMEPIHKLMPIPFK